MILMGFMTIIMISARTRKLMNRLHMEQAISSHRPPNSIAFKTFHVMIVIHDDENMAVHHSENNICSYKTSGCFLYTNKQLLFGIFTKCHLFVCFWTNNYNLSQKWEWCQLEMNTKVEWWKMNKWLLTTRKPFLVNSMKTRNWTQRIILKHLKPEDLGNVNFERRRQCHCLRMLAHPRPPPPLHRHHPHPHHHRLHCQSSHLCCWPGHPHLDQIQPGN